MAYYRTFFGYEPGATGMKKYWVLQYCSLGDMGARLGRPTEQWTFNTEEAAKDFMQNHKADQEATRKQSVKDAARNLEEHLTRFTYYD